MFADVGPDANSLKTLLSVTQYIAMWIIAIAGAVAVFRKPPKQERDVRLVSDGVSKVEFDRHVKAVTQAVEKLGAETKERFDTIDTESDDRRRTIYRMIDTS